MSSPSDPRTIPARTSPSPGCSRPSSDRSRFRPRSSPVRLGAWTTQSLLPVSTSSHPGFGHGCSQLNPDVVPTLRWNSPHPGSGDESPTPPADSTDGPGPRSSSRTTPSRHWVPDFVPASSPLSAAPESTRKLPASSLSSRPPPAIRASSPTLSAATGSGPHLSLCCTSGMGPQPSSWSRDGRQPSPGPSQPDLYSDFGPPRLHLRTSATRPRLRTSATQTPSRPAPRLRNSRFPRSLLSISPSSFPSSSARAGIGPNSVSENSILPLAPSSAPSEKDAGEEDEVDP